jgi:hypothetical protein
MGKNELKTQETPEERELAKKRSELAALEIRLAEDELNLATEQAELRDFESLYLRTVGSKYAELDQIEATIAERLAALHPKDPRTVAAAREAKARAEESAGAVGQNNERPTSPGGFKPSDQLRDLYRKVAKALHPDLATDPDEIKRRQRFMAQANQAYKDGDEARLRQILREWESAPESVKGDGPGAELVRTIRKIARVEERLAQIEIEIKELEETDLFRLRAKASAVQEDGRDLLAKMASELESKIAEARERLRKTPKPEARPK